MKEFRTQDYRIWSACERFGILPPDVKRSWDSCNVQAQARLIGYSQIRELEEFEMTETMAKIGVARSF